jgi:DHA1 family bicyclomycin/chloramphenicol resistance-like MFS transporter
VILSDSLQGNRLSKALFNLAIAAGVLTVLAPFIGGWITTAYRWRVIFGLLTIYLLLTGVAGMLLLPPKHKRQTIGVIAPDDPRHRINPW